MKDARFTIPTPQLLSRVVDMLDEIPMADRDTNGDLYEYLLSKIASAGVNGQFRTPRHIIKLMVDMVAPQPTDQICDPFVMRNFYVSRDPTLIKLVRTVAPDFGEGFGEVVG
jgi:type I restriction-modification system DNA methylase subunit